MRFAAGGVELEGDLYFPSAARGLVLFAHGSGSSRLSPRNRAVAADLNEAGFGTLLLDLLTEEEELEEPGALEEVSRLAAEWFGRWMQPLSAGAPAY
jgi:hypothetical protein